MSQDPIRVELKGRDIIELGADGQWRVVGCSQLLEELQRLRTHFGSDPALWPLPQDQDHVAILIRELILKSKGQWDFPYKDFEICHCRMVPTEAVDEIVISGIFDMEAISRLTMAGSSCGTCRNDIAKLVAFRRFEAGSP